MASPRIFVDSPLEINASLKLDERNRHHLLNVLRLKNGAVVTLFNGQGGEYTATLLISGKSAVAELHKFNDISRESPLNLQLIQAISRGDRMDYTLQKAVELGVSAIYPVFSERSMRKPDEKQLQKKFQHWRGIIISACEQSGRCTLPDLHQPLDLTDWLESQQLNTGLLRFILDPKAEDGLSRHNLSNVALLIGPEGGFSDNEINIAKSKGCTPIKLGQRILRTETAGIVALAICQALYGDLF